MHTIDWAIIAACLALIVTIAVFTRTLMKSVADFLAANRLAGRYLVSVADGMAGLGAISIAASFEKFYEAGFGAYWWGQILSPIGLILTLSGFVIYRYRETRVFTLAQFFEIRYSRRFRLFSGGLAFLSGIFNYGIFPAVTARFLIYFCQLPPELHIAGFVLPTLAPVMAIMLTFAVALTLSGGQIAVMITDFIQGQFAQISILTVFAILFWKIGWDGLITGLSQAPEGASRIDPFDQGNVQGFNPAFFFMIAALSVYGFRAWQGNQGYSASPKSPHEAKMAGILGAFRGQVMFLIINLIPLFIYAALHLPAFTEQADATQAILGSIDNPQIQTQMRVPAALSQMLPLGVMGLFAATIVAAAISTDDTYLHSWGSIFVQDVVIPLRGKPLSQKAHLLWLRGSIVGVAVFAFFFSLLFPLNEFIFMYFQITGAIFLGGAGAVLLGGLYWSRGTVEGAWAAMITGSVCAVTSIALQNLIWPILLPAWKQAAGDGAWVHRMPETFPLDGVQMSLIVAGLAMSAYVIFSLLSRRPPVNMDKLLNRGEYAVEQDGHHPTLPADLTRSGVEAKATSQTQRLSRPERFWRRIGVNEDFTRGDRAIFIGQFCFGMFFVVACVVGSLIQVFWDIPNVLWSKWWALTVGIAVVTGVVATVWFIWGGVLDLTDLTKRLRSVKRDLDDDGSVREDAHLQEP